MVVMVVQRLAMKLEMEEGLGNAGQMAMVESMGKRQSLFLELLDVSRQVL